MGNCSLDGSLLLNAPPCPLPPGHERVRRGHLEALVGSIFVHRRHSEGRQWDALCLPLPRHTGIRQRNQTKPDPSNIGTGQHPGNAGFQNWTMSLRYCAEQRGGNLRDEHDTWTNKLSPAISLFGKNPRHTAIFGPVLDPDDRKIANPPSLPLRLWFVRLCSVQYQTGVRGRRSAARCGTRRLDGVPVSVDI